MTYSSRSSPLQLDFEKLHACNLTGRYNSFGGSLSSADALL
jgi:hypothetical protein